MAAGSMIAIPRLSDAMKAVGGPRPRFPWLDPTLEAENVHERHSIEVPAADTLNTVITSFQVQPGYAATITDILFNFVVEQGGTPPIEGDETSLYYSLRRNGALFERGFETIDSSLGSLACGPYPIRAGIPLAAGELLEGLVSVPLGSGISTGPGNRVICHLIGWQWPIGKEC